MAQQAEITIRDFLPGDEAAFCSLNEEWITRHFKLEPKDREALADPYGSILNAGGRIFFAVAEGRCIGCCALIRIAEDEFEIAKMAVTPAWHGRGIGRRLLEATIQAARAAGTRRLYLETNHALAPAIHLYRSAGFEHLPAERLVSSPYARADVFMEMLLT